MGWPSLNGCFTCNLIKRVHESHYPLRDKSSRAKYICAHVRTHDHQRVVRGRSCQRRTRDPLAGERAVSGTPCPSQKRQKPVLRWITGCVCVIQNLPWRAPGADSVGSLWMLRTQEGKTTFFSSGPQCGESLPSWEGEEGTVRSQGNLFMNQKNSKPLYCSPKVTNLTCQMQVQLVDNPLTTDNLHSNCGVT